MVVLMALLFAFALAFATGVATDVCNKTGTDGSFLILGLPFGFAINEDNACSS